MEVSYETTKEDALAIIPFTMKNNPDVLRALKRGRLLMIVFGAFILLMAVALWFLDEKEFAVIAAVIAILLYPYSLFVNSLMRKSYTRALSRAYDKKPSKFITAHRLSIDAEGMKDVTEMGETLTHWPAIAQVGATDQYLFLIARGSSGAVVPRRAFAGEAEFKQFVADTQKLLEDNAQKR